MISIMMDGKMTSDTEGERGEVNGDGEELAPMQYVYGREYQHW